MWICMAAESCLGHSWLTHAHSLIVSLSLRLALVREEKEALAKALERLQVVGTGSTPGGARGLRDVVRNLEEQLLRERAKSQRSASKRGQEQRVLMEQVGFLIRQDSGGR